MNRKACVLVFDGLADWEPAHALCEIHKSGKFDVVTAGFSAQPVVTMGGMKLKPDTTISEVDWPQAAILILPGGDMWEKGPVNDLGPLLNQLLASGVGIAAICAATLEIARSGLTRGRRHTSNWLAYLKYMVPEYRDEAFYVDQLAVSDGNLITSSGLGSVEFAREIFRFLNIFSEEDAAIWYDMFKRGIVPVAFQSEGSGN